MADRDFIMKKHIISYLLENYSDIYVSQYYMISFSHTEYHKANSFGRVEDQIVNEVKEIPEYKAMVDSN